MGLSTIRFFLFKKKRFRFESKKKMNFVENTYDYRCDRFSFAHFAPFNWEETVMQSASAIIFKFRSCNLIGDGCGGDGQECLSLRCVQFLIVRQTECVAFVFALRHIDTQILAVRQM